MPTYEYACRQCGEHLEVVQSFKDEPLTECPNCGGSLRKVFGAAGIIFKGSGYYVTDSRPKQKAASGGRESGDEAAASSADKSADKAAGGTADSGSGTGGSGAGGPGTGATSKAKSGSDTSAPPAA